MSVGRLRVSPRERPRTHPAVGGELAFVEQVEDLRALGYGIEATRGVHGGYRLGPGAAVPPLALSQQEAVAIAVGLRAAALGAVTGLEDASARALAKLEQSLGSATRKQITDVERAMVPLGSRRDDIDFQTVVTLARAIAESQRIRIDYTRRDGEATRRRLEPYRIVHTIEHWYLIAWDTDRRAWRTLRVDRVMAPTVLRETFTPRAIPDEQVRAYTTASIATAPYQHRVRLRVHAPVEAVTREFGPTIAQVEDAGDGTTVLTTGSNSLGEIALYIGLSGLEFDILDGEGLSDVLRSLIRRFERAIHSQM